MAEKRMISKVISISEKVNELPDIFDMLLFTWMIPHTDDFGRLAGSPAKVKALVVPMLDKLVSDVKESLHRLQSAGLIEWYEADGQKVVQVVNFEAHQQGLHKRTRSKFPDPPLDFPGSSGNFPNIPLEENRREENRTEQKGREENGTEQISGSSLPEIDNNPFRLFENEGFGTISPLIADEIAILEKDYGNRWLCEAMKKAVVAGKRSMSYVNGILKNWKAEGIDEPWTKEKPPNKGGGRSGKQPIDIVKSPEPGDEQDVSQEEYEELLRLAERMQSGKGEQR
ncbi:putative prophage replication protein O [Paenibacillus polymyxa]|uniref:DnaD domain-containing protein n=1 Tax=Paenibacillus polymyxa TaxID=1406 RepID=UPI000D916836|nr:DnaD domain protein [Paenibacillus polymyxa]SPY16938.1 putative prophage replication protein O [Paenibacillus polymyxa]